MSRKITVEKTSKHYDADNVFVRGTYVGYKGKVGGKYGLVRCPFCRRENYAMMVSVGICASCNFDLNKLAKQRKIKLLNSL